MINIFKLLTIIFYITLFLTSCSDSGNNSETTVFQKNDNTYIPSSVKPILNDIQHKSFKYFYDGADIQTGLTLEGTERGDLLTIGGTGFGLMSLIIGTERNWISRSEAVDRTLKICNFLQSCERFNGVWSHWYKPSGEASAFGNQVKTGDIVETGLLVQGLIAAKEYYRGSEPSEKQISAIIDSLCNTINWRFYTNSEDVLYWLWHSQEDKFELPLTGWNEGLISYILALSAPKPHNIDIDAYNKGWKRNNNYYYPIRSYYGYSLPLGPDMGGPLFLSQYSMMGLNPKLMSDSDVNYWIQNVNHTMINRHYCIYDAPKNYQYNQNMWGLSSCYGVGTTSDYIARSPKNDDGVIATTAALSSYPYTPFYSTQVLLNLSKLTSLNTKYGLGDSYKPSEAKGEKRILAINQGPIVVMIENYRTGLIWNLVMKNEYIKKGLELANITTNPKFDDGFNLALINTETKVYDMLIHPDRGMYEIDFYSKEGGNIQFIIKSAKGEIAYKQTISIKAGANIISFFDEKIQRGAKYKLEASTSTVLYEIDVILR